ncbi:MAG: DUF378 domain-containing protein [Alphaproteobacteria bacterium]|nr:DUF378 domain-containing protein [Alphaproteobacteria bacterium]
MILQKTALLLTIIGGINWGLVGAFDWNVLNILSFAPILISIVEIIIALAACYVLYAYFIETANPAQK